MEPIPLPAYRCHKPQAGSYYVVYGDGYTSVSPAKPFEDGYKAEAAMPPHQQRVLREKAELDEKLSKLNEFIDKSPIFQGLPEDERERLIHQYNCMVDYSDALEERIQAF